MSDHHRSDERIDVADLLHLDDLGRGNEEDLFPAERRAALAAVASHCTVHNTLTTQPDITVTVTVIAE